jgi:hypothetical protein
VVSKLLMLNNYLLIIFVKNKTSKCSEKIRIMQYKSWEDFVKYGQPRLFVDVWLLLDKMITENLSAFFGRI